MPAVDLGAVGRQRLIIWSILMQCTVYHTTVLCFFTRSRFMMSATRVYTLNYQQAAVDMAEVGLRASTASADGPRVPTIATVDIPITSPATGAPAPVAAITASPATRLGTATSDQPNVSPGRLGTVKIAAVGEKAVAQEMDEIAENLKRGKEMSAVMPCNEEREEGGVLLASEEWGAALALFNSNLCFAIEGPGRIHENQRLSGGKGERTGVHGLDSNTMEARYY